MTLPEPQSPENAVKRPSWREKTAMDLGIFMMPCHPPSKPKYQTYEEDTALLVLADELRLRPAGLVVQWW